MHRIDAADNVSGQFTDGVPGTTPATVCDSAWLNDIQENVCQAVEGAGIALVKGDGTQLKSAINALAGTQAAPAIVGVYLTADLTSVANGSNWPLTPAGYLGGVPAFIAPYAGKISNLYVQGSAQGGGQVGIGLNSTSINTTLKAGITNAAKTSDLADSVSVAAGDVIYIIYNNNTGGVVATQSAGLAAFVEITRS